MAKIHKKKKTNKRIVPEGPYEAMKRTKKRLEYTTFHNAFMDPIQKREMARRAHYFMYDRLSPGARFGAYTRIGPDTLSSIFPDI